MYNETTDSGGGFAFVGNWGQHKMFPVLIACDKKPLINTKADVNKKREVLLLESINDPKSISLSPLSIHFCLNELVKRFPSG